MTKARIGAQLYSTRAFCKDMHGIRDTLKRVKDIGYQVVQISGFGPVEPSEVAEAIAAEGLTVGATHLGWKRFQEDLDGVIALHKQWNCKHTAIGGLPNEYFSREGVARFAAEVQPIVGRLAAEGMDFSYHNHNHELAHYGNQTWLEALLAQEAAQDVKAEVDTYWIQAGGADPAAFIRRYADRITILHLKDMIVTPEREQRFAPVGSGNLNWDALLEAMDQSQTEFAFVEQDQCYDDDVFACLEQSYRFLAGKGYA